MEAAIKTEEFLPLREPTFFILLSISNQKKHGYAILQDTESLSGGKIKLSNGTLYGALTRLLDQGLIERVPSDEPAASGKPRKAYQLTRTGASVLQAEIERLENLVRTARRHLPELTG
ncbi:MAG: helix-turn-helix transcriptional regulator [Anaerolineales bacterium]|nr:helix-turn-helix transcriptional regulator [Anaerolineales bacterium]